MAIKDILTLLDINRPDSPALDLAVAVAARVSAHLTGYGQAVEPSMPSMIDVPIPDTYLQNAWQETLNRTRTAADFFQQKAQANDVTCEPRIVPVASGEAVDTFTLHARLTDLVVIGQDHPDKSEHLRDLLIEAALFESSRPVLLAPMQPYTGPHFERIMVCWDGGRAAARAIRAALPLLSLAKDVHIVMIDDAAKKQPGMPGADIATYLSRHGIQSTVQTINTGRQVSVANMMLNYVADNAMDTIVMGAYGHSRLRELILGGATRSILSGTTVPVIMAH